MNPSSRRSCATENPVPAALAYRRTPDEVMRLARLGSFHPSRLSFLQSLLRQLAGERWRFERTAWQIDDSGVGHALYTVRRGDRAYTLVCFAHDLPAHARSDRVIATAWDATFALFDGEPSTTDVARLSDNVPRQEAGRVTSRELTLSRANRSVRLFDHVVERLAAGTQPDPEGIERTGYLMRTTAVYGSGKFGAADRSRIASRPELRGPFRAEMLTVWLIRTFTIDLVEHLARVRGGDQAVRLDADLRRRLGVGNSTGLGMAPFLMNHPVLLNHWVMAREEALARVRAELRSTAATRAAFRDALARARDNAAQWQSDHPVQRTKLDALRQDLASLDDRITPPGDPASRDGADEFDDSPLGGDHPWDALWRWSDRHLSYEGQEALVSLLLEPHADLIDELCDCMDADETAHFRIDGDMSTRELIALVRDRYGWALSIDHESRHESARFWYVSEEKLEPRLGERYDEPGAALEQPLAIARDVTRLAHDLDGWRGAPDVAGFLSAHPEHRHVVRRAQIAARFPFAEIRDNLVSADLLPIDLLRCKLSFFGASRFDPRSDRWVRICLYQDMPYPDELLEAAA